MGEARVKVDLLNPGQVFACLGLMELAELLCGACTGRYEYAGRETTTKFVLRVPGEANPVRRSLDFLRSAEVMALVPAGSGLSAKRWQIESSADFNASFPSPVPDTPATLPALLSFGGRSILLSSWADGGPTGRDNVKFWAGSGGYPGAGLVRDAIDLLRATGKSDWEAAIGEPFALAAMQTSSFRFDWRRDYRALDAGFSPNDHGSRIEMVGYPLVELLALCGIEHGRPRRHDKLLYSYGACNAELPTALSRVVLGGVEAGTKIRQFRMRLGWPGQEGQARCILDAVEEQNP